MISMPLGDDDNDNDLDDGDDGDDEGYDVGSSAR